MSAVAIKRVPQIHPAPSLHDTQNGLHFVNSGINNFITTLPVKEITAVDDKWDSEHVRLPCSKRSLYPVKKQAGKITGLRQRWKLIVDALFVDEIKTPTGLAEAILKYNSRFKGNFETQ